MNKYNKILMAALLIFMAVACAPESDLELALDLDRIEIGPEGGARILNVSSSEHWVASTQEPWITISPANGRGTAQCKVMIDSTLKWEEKREGKVFINGANSSQSFTIVQDGFDYQIVLDKPEVTVPDYAEYGKRSFEVKVKANIDFDVVVPDSAQNSILKFVKRTKLVLDRDARPREVTLKFDWVVSSRDIVRNVGVKFIPKDGAVTMGRHDTLAFFQKAAPSMPEDDPVACDSLALLAINRALGVWTEFDTSERMEHWTGIEVWKTKDERNGRVKSASFAAFTTKEGIPFEVQYLTAAEELSFYGNTNTFLIKELDCGPYICLLSDLKRLTIGAYGLSGLHEDFSNLTGLEYLNLESNNFQKIPDVLNGETFPALHALILNANTRYTVMDLSNETRENIGGFIEEEKFPIRLLAWDNLDTLRLSANYLQGTLPTDEEVMEYFSEIGKPVSYWRTELDEVNKINVRDSIAEGCTFFNDHDIPKVLPRAEFLAINLNRFHGNLPDWLLYHPKLDLWFPDLLVWSQEGKAADGTMAKFDNAPTNMQYYYDIFVNKKYNPKNYSDDNTDEE